MPPLITFLLPDLILGLHLSKTTTCISEHFLTEVGSRTIAGGRVRRREADRIVDM